MAGGSVTIPFDLIINHLYSGLSVAKAVAKVGVNAGDFYRLLIGNPELMAQFEDAQRIKVEIEVERLKDISENENISESRARNMIQVRQWIASKLIPKKYGDRVDVNVQQTIDISGAIEAGKRRVSDSARTIDVQAIDMTQSASGYKPLEPQKIVHKGSAPRITSLEDIDALLEQGIEDSAQHENINGNEDL